MFDTTAKQILNYYKKEFNITNKNIIMEDLQRQIEYTIMNLEKREKHISKLEKKINDWNIFRGELRITNDNLRRWSMLSDSSIKSIKVKLAKAIELIVNEQSKEYNSKLCEVQVRLETIYDVIDNSIYKRTGMIGMNIGDGNKKVNSIEHN